MTITNDRVSIIWYINGPWYTPVSHAALVVDDKVFGAFLGKPERESSSLKKAIEKVQEHKSKSYSTIALQKVKVTDEQYANIKSITSQFYSGRKIAPPCGSCMHSVFRVLQVAGVEINAPPFPLNQLSDTSRLYLIETEAQNKNPLLGKIHYYGKSTNEKSWGQYLKNVVVAPATVTYFSTFFVSFFVLPKGWPVELTSLGVGALAALYTAYTTHRVFSAVVNGP